MTITGTFSAAGVSQPLYVRSGEDFDYSLTNGGTFVESVSLERSADGGLTWEQLVTGIVDTVASTRLRNDGPKNYLYRFHCYQVGGGFTGTMDYTLADVVEDVAGNQWKNAAGVTVGAVTEDGIRADKATIGIVVIGAVTLTATATELNIMDGVTSTTAELNILDGVTSTAAELNILDGVTSTAAELNILDGVTSTAAELNILDGVTSTAAELNILDGVTATAANINTACDLTANTETIAAGVGASVTKKNTKIDSTPGAGAITLAAPDASLYGSIKTIEMTVDGGDVTLALTNVVGGSAATTATFANVGEMLVLLASTSKWIVLKEYGVVLS